MTSVSLQWGGGKTIWGSGGLGGIQTCMTVSTMAPCSHILFCPWPFSSCVRHPSVVVDLSTIVEAPSTDCRHHALSALEGEGGTLTKTAGLAPNYEPKPRLQGGCTRSQWHCCWEWHAHQATRKIVRQRSKDVTRPPPPDGVPFLGEANDGGPREKSKLPHAAYLLQICSALTSTFCTKQTQATGLGSRRGQNGGLRYPAASI